MRARIAEPRDQRAGTRDTGQRDAAHTSYTQAISHNKNTRDNDQRDTRKTRLTRLKTVVSVVLIANITQWVDATDANAACTAPERRSWHPEEHTTRRVDETLEAVVLTTWSPRSSRSRRSKLYPRSWRWPPRSYPSPPPQSSPLLAACKSAAFLPPQRTLARPCPARGRHP